MSDGQEGARKPGNSFSAFDGIEQLAEEDEGDSESETGAEESAPTSTSSSDVTSTQTTGDTQTAAGQPTSHTGGVGSKAQSTKSSSVNQATDTSSDGGQVADPSALPHRVKHDSPKDGRKPLNMYVSEDDKERIRELNNLANRTFDEKINRIDVYVAALRCDFYDDESFIAEMQKIGYGFFD